jgi:hypothetical protein
MDRLRSEYHCSRGAGGCFGARDEMLVAVATNDGNVDVSCAGIISDDVAGDGDSLVGVSSAWAAVSVLVSMMMTIVV